MLRQIILITTIIFLGHYVFAQEIILEQNIKLKSYLKSHIINHQNGIFLLQSDKKNINLHSLDKNYKITQSLSEPRLNIGNLTFSQLPHEPVSASHKLKLMNYAVQDESCYLYWTNRPSSPSILYKEKSSVFVAQEYNMKNGTVEIHELPIQLSKETFLNSFSENGKFYLLAIKNKSSILKLYVIDGGELIEEKEFDLSSYKFGSNNDENLYQSIRDRITWFRIPVINYDDLYLNQKTFKHHKIYHDSNSFSLTEDSRGTATKIITVNLKDFSFGLKEYEFGKCDCSLGMLSMDTNSFLMDNYLYQIVICDKAIYTSIFDLLKNKEIQSFQATKNEIVSLKKPLRKTSKKPEIKESFFTLHPTNDIMYDHVALRRIANKAISITAYKKENFMEVVIGAMKVPFKTEADYTSLVNAIIPNVHNYRISYLYQTYFKSLLEQPSLGFVPSSEEYALDKMNTYLKEKIESTNADVYAETMYSIQNGYILGYYSKRKKKYYLVKFLN